jgi:putative SOS response-associated peptidase YedK
VAPLHNRMPVIIPDGLEQAWLETKDGPGLRALEPLLQGWDPGDWIATPPPVRAGRSASDSQQLLLFPGFPE